MLSRYFAWTWLHKFNEISRNARQSERWTGCQESEMTTLRWRTHNKSFLHFDRLVLNWSSFTRSPGAVVAPARNSYNCKHMNHKSFDGDELSSLILIIQLRIISSRSQPPSKELNSAFHGPKLIPHITNQEEDDDDSEAAILFPANWSFLKVADRVLMTHSSKSR